MIRRAVDAGWLRRKVVSCAQSLACAADRLHRDERGVSAVEFAMILPLMVLMYVGTIEVTSAVSANRKMVATASTIGDLAAQAQDISNSDMANIFDASSAVMNPFSTASLRLRVSQIRIDQNGTATVAWSDGRNIAPLARGSAFTGLPAGVAVRNTNVIVSQVTYSYTSPLGNMIVGPILMSEDFYFRPRIGDCVRRNGSCT
jgi:Flp pilus assembly protein TadG